VTLRTNVHTLVRKAATAQEVVEREVKRRVNAQMVCCGVCVVHTLMSGDHSRRRRPPPPMHR
jgi:hypothetical protein